MPSPPKTPIATDQPLDPTDSRATLTILRTFKHLMGEIAVTGAVPLFFNTNPNDPEAPTDFIGYGTGTTTMICTDVGGAGSYETAGEWPVRFSVDGVLTPRPGMPTA